LSSIKTVEDYFTKIFRKVKIFEKPT